MPGPEPRRRGLLDAVLVPGPRVQRRHAVDGLRAALGGAALAATALLASTHEVSGAERSVFEAVNRLPQTVAPALWAVMQAGSLPAVFVTAGLALAARRPIGSARPHRRLPSQRARAGEGAAHAETPAAGLAGCRCLTGETGVPVRP